MRALTVPNASPCVVEISSCVHPRKKASSSARLWSAGSFSSASRHAPGKFVRRRSIPSAAVLPRLKHRDLAFIRGKLCDVTRAGTQPIERKAAGKQEQPSGCGGAAGIKILRAAPEPDEGILQCLLCLGFMAKHPHEK